MKRIILTTFSIMLFGSLLNAQAPATNTKDWSKLNLTGRSADHLVLQFGTDFWTGKPDSVKTGGGLSRHFNIYFMYDVPFKTNPHYSVAFGAGIGTSNIFFDDHTAVDVRSSANSLPFKHLDSLTSHFSKSKVTTIYVQAPVELRYFSNPENPSKSWKFGVGLKVGTLLKAYTKSKNYVNSANLSVYGKNYIEKKISNRFFNTTDIGLTGRVGYGMVSFDLGYQVTGVLRDGFGPVMNKVSAGITISGL